MPEHVEERGFDEYKDPVLLQAIDTKFASTLGSVEADPKRVNFKVKHQSESGGQHADVRNCINLATESTASWMESQWNSHDRDDK